MNKGVKIALWAAAGFLFAGGVLMAAGKAAGGFHQAERMLDEKLEQLDSALVDQIVKAGEDHGYYEGEEQTMSQGVFVGDFEEEIPAARMPYELDIELGVHELTIVEGDTEGIFLKGKNTDGIQCYVDEGELILKDIGKKKINHKETRELILTVPKDIVWAEANINAGMSSVETARLQANEAELDADMGYIGIGQILAEQLDVSADMGEVELKAGSAGSLEASADMGHVSYTGEVRGNVEAEADMGEISLLLTGQETDFNYQIQADMGAVTVADQAYSGLSQRQTVNNQASKWMELEAAMGSIEISFQPL